MENIKQLEKTVFNTLYDIDTSEREQVKETGRTSLNYLPWATVYSEVCKNFDDVKYEFLRQTKEVEEIIRTVVDETTTREKHIRYTEELPYFDTPLGLEVRTRVTINGISKEMNLPVYNASYKGLGSTPYEYDTKNGKAKLPAARLDDVYKSIMRCFAKNLSMWGVGLYMWTKEDAAESVLQMNKLQAECMEVLNKKCALSEKTKLKVMEICKEVLPDENGDPRLCDDNEKLKELKKKLMAVRKIA